MMVLRKFVRKIQHWLYYLPSALFNPWKCIVCGYRGCHPLDHPGATFWECQGNQYCQVKYWDYTPSDNEYWIVEMPMVEIEFCNPGKIRVKVGNKPKDYDEIFQQLSQL